MKKMIALCATLALGIPALTFAAGSVAEAKLGKGIADREISEESHAFALNERAWLWLRVVDGAGETLTVTWANGDQSYPVTLDIGANAWRTWSNKALHLPGEWTVTVTDSAGATLHQATLTVE